MPENRKKNHISLGLLLRLFLSIPIVMLMIAGCVYGGKSARTSKPTGVKQTGERPLPEGIVKSAVALGPDDVFEVRVFQEEELSSLYRVSNKGTINFPLIGEVVVEGKTPSVIEKEISERLEKDYLKKAYVSIFVKEFNSKKIFVFGEVKKPGTFRYEDKMSIIQAITLAGGLTQTASKSNVSITRIVQGIEKHVTIEVDKIWKGEEANFLLKPGDIIFVPETLF